ncbi:anti-sigma factor [Streptomyces roseolilacinus]|uniref:hypothetical protein n=1 Tax=Streptomyces roseolilacinus TaxID=66904 RepID=UPI003805A6C1
MTPTADTTRHPDVSEISDLTEGILPPSRTADVRRHLDRCDLCADVRSSLEEIRGLLGTLPGPARMPVDVAERIDAALAAEALLDATTPDDAAPVSRETTQKTAGPDPVRPRKAERPTSAPASRPPGSTGPGRAPARRRRGAVVSAACGLAAVGLGVLFFQTANQNGDAPGTSYADHTTASGDTRFSGSTLTDKVRSLLASPKRSYVATSPRLQPEGESPDTANPMIEKADPPLPSCVRRGIARNEQPLAAERGDYQGRSAYLVVLPHPRTETQVDVYVVDAFCTTAKNASDPADVLLKQSQPRP